MVIILDYSINNKIMKDSQMIGLLVIGFIVVIFVIRMIILKRRNGQKDLRVKLVEKSAITHDTYVFTFLLQNQQEPLGLKIGQHLQIRATIKTKQFPQGELVTRKYTPISQINKKGSFDLVVKIYRPCERFPQGGKMTQWLENKNVGDQINIRIPYGRFNYLGNGTISVKDFGGATSIKSIKKLYMIAGGTGITPLYQIIQFISETKEQEIELILLALNRTEDDILLQKELRQFQKINPKFKCYFSVDKQMTQEWKGFVGFLDKHKVQTTLKEFNKDTFCVSCGPPILCNIVEKILAELNVSQDQMFRF